MQTWPGYAFFRWAIIASRASRGLRAFMRAYPAAEALAVVPGLCLESANLPISRGSELPISC
jgi:hypothetical protein